MTDNSEFFRRVAGRVNLPVLRDAFVVVIGAGSVGSAIGDELARCGVGHLAFMDGDPLEPHNVPRHVLSAAYVGTNKAEAMAAHLRIALPGLDVGAIPRYVDDSLSDLELDSLLAAASLIIITTDDRGVQRRVARRALALDIPAVIPGLYVNGGGEVFIQLGPGQACFLCWDDFRDADAEVRGVTAINADALAVNQQAVFLALAILDPSSRHARDMAPPRGDDRPRQLFVLRPGSALLRALALRRDGCPSCAVGPSPLVGDEGAAARPRDVAARMHPRGGERDVAAGWAFTLAADPAPPTIGTITVSAPLVVEGDAVTLSWTAANATHVEVETLGRRAPTGTARVQIRATRSIRIVAVNPFGRTEALSPVVRAIPLPRLGPLDPPAFPALGAPVPFAPPALTSVRSLVSDHSIRPPLGGPPFPAWPPPILFNDETHRRWPR
jgi:molybdopterin/thiamine biosynthesis adenylyltransferase